MSTSPSDGYALFFGERPVAKARPRQGKGHFYTPRRTKAWERALGWAWATKYGSQVIYPAPQALGTLSAFYFHDRRYADLDNLIKSTWDGINGLAWEDDSQIVVAHACRHINSCAGVGLWVVDGSDPCSICRAMCKKILKECPWAGERNGK